MVDAKYFKHKFTASVVALCYCPFFAYSSAIIEDTISATIKSQIVSEHNSQGSDFSETMEYSRTKLRKLIIKEESAGEAPPYEVIEKLSQLSTIANKKNWFYEALLAQVTIAEVYMSLEDFNKTKQVHDTYAQHANALNHESLIIRYRLVKLFLDSINGYSVEVKDEFQSLIALAESMPNTKEAARIHIDVGHAQVNFDLLRPALKNYQIAYRYLESQNNLANMSFVLSAMSTISSKLDDHEMAIRYLQEAIDINEKLGNEYVISILHFNLAEAYASKGDNKLAIASFKHSITMAKKLSDHIGIAWAEQALADLHYDGNNPQTALKLYLKNEQAFINSADGRMLFHNLMGQAKTNLALGNLEDSELAINNASEILSRINYPDATLKYSKYRAKLSFAQGKFFNAYHELDDYISLYNEINSAEKAKMVEKLRIRFDAQQQENKNEVLQKENELHQLKEQQYLREQTYFRAMMALAIALILIGSFALWRQTTNKNKFAKLALHDSLTGAANRRHILSFAEELISDNQQKLKHVSIAIIDLDHFKQINDNFGHHVGDLVLKVFAKACKAELRAQDYFGRYGGEEWLLVLHGANDVEIESVCQRIFDRVNKFDIKGFSGAELVKFSVGVATSASLSDNFHFTLQCNINGDPINLQENQPIAANKALKELINHADTNLYHAKANGRNQIVFDDHNYAFSLSS